MASDNVTTSLESFEGLTLKGLLIMEPAAPAHDYMIIQKSNRNTLCSTMHTIEAHGLLSDVILYFHLN